MRLGVTGKGGTGKTTFSGTLARLIGRERGSVLAIDGDPNPNLALVIGVRVPDSARRLPTDLLAVREDAEGHRRAELARPIEEIVAEFGVVGPDSVSLLTLGEIDHAGAG